MPEPVPAAQRNSAAIHRSLQRASKHIESGNYVQAIASLERALQNGADVYTCTLRMAELYRVLGQRQAALIHASNAVKLSPEKVPAYELVITIALELGEFHQAITASHNLIRLVPNHLPAHNALGTAYLQIGEFDSALRAVNTLVRLEPGNPQHHFKKAILCQHKEEYAMAAFSFLQMLRIDPQGENAELAKEALNMLENSQLHQIVTLLAEDRVFRLKFQRDPISAVQERGFMFSEGGFYALQNIGEQLLEDIPPSSRNRLYN
jgi:tetratricopeptide (TPR) repeat protein